MDVAKYDLRIYGRALNPAWSKTLFVILWTAFLLKLFILALDPKEMIELSPLEITLKTVEEILKETDGCATKLTEPLRRHIFILKNKILY